MAQAHRLSISQVWTDMVALFAAHREGVGALAGVFLFLPNLAINLFLPEPKVAATPADFANALVAFYQAHWLSIGGALLALQLGTLALLVLLLAKPAGTLGASLRRALQLVPGLIGLWAAMVLLFLLVTLVSLFVAGIFAALFGGGMAIRILFILIALVPVVYCYGRTMLSLAAMAGDPQPNPIDALFRSIRMTRGFGWTLLGGFMLLLSAMILFGALAGGISGALSAALPAAVGHSLSAIVNSAISTSGGLLSTLYVAAAYTQLSSADPLYKSGT